MNIAFLIISPLLLLATGIFATASLKLPTRPAKLISVVIIGFAEIVLIAEILGLIYRLSYREFWLAAQVVILLAAGYLWRRRGRPALKFDLAKPTLPVVIASIRAYPLLWVLGVVTFLAYLIGAFLVLYVPPNNYDGLTYHLSRVGYWLQFDSLFPWQTYNIRQLTFPPNAEIALLWTVLLRGTDQFAGFVQWIAALVSAVGVFGLGRILHFSRAQSLFPALIYLNLSQVFLQSTTVQNDLVISLFCVSALYFLLLGLQARHYGALLISGIAIGLAIGAKSTALFILPGFACVALLLWFQNRKSFRLFVFWGSVCLVSSFVWGAYIYVVNTAAFNNPLGVGDFVEVVSSSSERTNAVTYSRLELLIINAPRYLTQMFDFTSLDEVGRELTRVKYELFDRVFDNTPPATAWVSGAWDWLTSKTIWWGPNEDVTWFGPLGVLLFLPGLGYGILLSIKRRDITPFCIALLAIVFFLAHSAAQRYTPAKGRYYVLPVTVASVLMIWVVTIRGAPGHLLRIFVVFLTIVIVHNNIMMNSYKGLMNVLPIGRDRDHLAYPADPLTTLMDRYVPPDAKVIYVGGNDTRDFRLFGTYLTRYIVPVVLTQSQNNAFEAIRTQMPVFYLGEGQHDTSDAPADYVVIDAMTFERISPDTTGFESVGCAQEVCLFRLLGE